MFRFNKLFGGEPPGEPEWLREFARGGEPSMRKDEASWPYAGLPTIAELVVQVQTALATDGTKMTTAEITSIVRKALATVQSSGSDSVRSSQLPSMGIGTEVGMIRGRP